METTNINDINKIKKSLEILFNESSKNLGRSDETTYTRFQHDGKKGAAWNLLRSQLGKSFNQSMSEFTDIS